LTTIRNLSGTASLAYNNVSREISYTLTNYTPLYWNVFMYSSVPSNNINQTSYTFANGLVIKYGQTLTQGGNTTINVLFTTPFQSYCNSIVITQINSDFTNSAFASRAGYVTPTGFSIWNASLTGTQTWIALGW
jgi:hypothetical protein